jgi:hypothetical protein
MSLLDGPLPQKKRSMSISGFDLHELPRPKNLLEQPGYGTMGHLPRPISRRTPCMASKARYAFIWEQLRLSDNLTIVSRPRNPVKNAKLPASTCVAIHQPVIQCLKIFFGVKVDHEASTLA